MSAPGCQVPGCREPAEWVKVETFPGCDGCRDDLTGGESYTVTIYLCQKHGRIYEGSCAVDVRLQRLAVITLAPREPSAKDLGYGDIQNG